MQLIKFDQRSTGSTKTDVIRLGTHLNGRARLSSLDEPAALEREPGGVRFTLNVML